MEYTLTPEEKVVTRMLQKERVFRNHPSDEIFARVKEKYSSELERLIDFNIITKETSTTGNTTRNYYELYLNEKNLKYQKREGFY